MLPTEFLERMKHTLGEEYPAFLKSYERKRYQALRLNPMKGSREDFLRKIKKQYGENVKGSFSPVPWCEHGFYYSGCVRVPGKADEEEEIKFSPGKHPYHEAGVYYIQEPSAMAPAEYLDVRPGMHVLDLCAAPGGKSTQIAAAMKGQGILVCNEIHPARAKILSENIERMGITNAIVTNETPQRLAAFFSGYFDRILVDAPCSGEGMFVKNGAAVEEWSLENVQMCAKRQDEILDEAYKMLAPGGRMVYSTCTFAPAEDEGSVERFLERHSQMRVVEPELFDTMEPGALPGTIRIWPHKAKGEGHFAAVLEKAAECENSQESGKRKESRNGRQKGLAEKSCDAFFSFAAETLSVIPEGIFVSFGDQLYLLPQESPCLQGLKVLRPGLHLGTNKKNRFEPSHALALALNKKSVRLTANLDEEGAADYLAGATFSWEGEKGWYLITVDDYSLGWGKLSGGVMKNHYPKGLRRQ